MSENEQLLAIIRAAMKTPSSGSTSKPSPSGKQSPTIKPSNGKGVQKSKLQPRESEHGKLGDFSRSNSNPISRSVSNSVSVGFEDVSEAGDGSLLATIRIAINNTGGAPSKRQAKHMASPKMTRSDRVFSSTGVGSSRSVTLGIIKAIAHPETGCIVRPEAIPLIDSQKNSNTTQGNYNPMIVE